MPTILRIGGYRFFFYSNESNEPRHVHVQKVGMLAKFWLGPVALASNSGFPAHELSKVKGMVMTHEQCFMEAWDEFFGA